MKLLASVLCCIIIVSFITTFGYAQEQTKVVPPERTAAWHLAAAGFPGRLIAKVNGMSPDWRAYQPITVMLGWILVESAQPAERGGLGRIYPQNALQNFLNKFQYYQFGHSSSLEIAPDFYPPKNPKVEGATVSCDAEGQELMRLFRFDPDRGFLLVEITGVPSEKRMDFPNVPSGRYVIGFSNKLERMPTQFLDVR